MIGAVVLCGRPCCPGYVEAIARPPGIDLLAYCEKVINVQPTFSPLTIIASHLFCLVS